VQRLWILFFLFHVFHSKRGVISCKKIAVTSNLERRSGDLRTRLKINWKPVCPHRELSENTYSCLFDRNQNLLLFDVTAIFLHEITPLLLWNTWNKKNKIHRRCTKITLYHPRQMYVYLRYLTIQISQKLLSCRAIQKSLVYLA
jgi:hypothetical protein